MATGGSRLASMVLANGRVRRSSISLLISGMTCDSGRGGVAVLIWPDTDVIVLQSETNAAFELQRVDVLAWELETSGAVEDSKLLGDDVMVTGVIQCGAPQRL
jgi:hypothetical protein